MSDNWDDRDDERRSARCPPRQPPARQDNRLTQNVRAALEKMGYETTEHEDVNNPIEAGADLAKHITSTSGVVGLLAVAMTLGLFALVWQLMGGQQEALGTVATHQTAMQRRIDAMKDELEDVRGELVNLRFALSQRSRQDDYRPRSPFDGRSRNYSGQKDVPITDDR